MLSIKDIGLDYIIVEGDCESLFKILALSGPVFNWKIASIVWDIQSLMEDFQNICFNVVPRFLNRLDHEEYQNRLSLTLP